MNTSISASNKKLEGTIAPESNRRNSLKKSGITKDQSPSVYCIESSELSIGKNEWDEVFELDDS